ncbi:MAG: SMP-30/gluconolactonase/LRE family protein [candidate division Zixibacteria bacterium]|nr:SMP-30/gluconolactonase/LRE family protein [candidate division Zixibacteria bacterium]
MKYKYAAVIILTVLYLYGLSAVGSFAREDIIAFDTNRWDISGARITEYLGRTCLMGTAFLKDVEFENGVIEVDIAVKKMRSYPGMNFRIQSPGNLENFYIRPHRSPFYTDVLQYTPVFDGLTGWQLYNGEGYTAGYDIPYEQWLRVRLEVHGRQARVFINDDEAPALLIHDLKHGVSKGTIGVTGPVDGSAYFSNFSYRLDDSLRFDPPPQPVQPLGLITEWELSPMLMFNAVDLEKSYREQGLTDLTWQEITSEESGLVNIARFVQRDNPLTNCIFARKIIETDKNEERELAFGYSDIAAIFLNDRLLFSGNSSYQLRDPSFLGIVGLNDYIVLPLDNGANELVFLLAEQMGGWGFIAQFTDTVFQHENLAKAWESHQKGLVLPESVVYDKNRNILYVSNYFNGGRGNEFISKVRLDGEIENPVWVAELDRPLGICLYNDKLYVVERRNLVEINITAAQIENRYPFPSPLLPNDVTVDKNGTFYVSDSRRNCLYRFKDGAFEVWLEGGEISDPNGMCFDKGRLLVGTSGDGCLKEINPVTGEIKNFVCFGIGSFIDGVRSDGNGNYIVSDYNGRVFAVTAEGRKTELLNTTAHKNYCADLEFISDRHLLVIPSFIGNRLTAYKLEATP